MAALEKNLTHFIEQFLNFIGLFLILRLLIINSSSCYELGFCDIADMTLFY